MYLGSMTKWRVSCGRMVDAVQMHPPREVREIQDSRNFSAHEYRLRVVRDLGVGGNNPAWHRVHRSATAQAVRLTRIHRALAVSAAYTWRAPSNVPVKITYFPPGENV